MKTPIIAIANYVFNGLKEAAVTINEKKVSEAYITVSTEKKCVIGSSSNCREEDPHNPEIISRMKVDWSFRPVDDITTRFNDPLVLPILK